MCRTEYISEPLMVDLFQFGAVFFYCSHLFNPSLRIDSEKLTPHPHIVPDSPNFRMVDANYQNLIDANSESTTLLEKIAVLKGMRMSKKNLIHISSSGSKEDLTLIHLRLQKRLRFAADLVKALKQLRSVILRHV